MASRHVPELVALIGSEAVPELEASLGDEDRESEAPHGTMGGGFVRNCEELSGPNDSEILIVLYIYIHIHSVHWFSLLFMAGHKGLLKQTSDLFTVANFGEQMHVWNLGDERNDVLSQLDSQPILSRAGPCSQAPEGLTRPKFSNVIN